MGLFDFFFKRTDCGKHTITTCRLLNSIKRQNSNLSEIEALLQIVLSRYGDNVANITSILANIYHNSFYDGSENKLKFGLMDVVVCCIYFEYGARPFNDDKYLIGKIGQLMREEGFTSREINGVPCSSEDFPEAIFNQYLARKELTPAYLQWRNWM